MSSPGKRRANGDAFIYEIVDGPEMLVIGLSARTSNAAEAGPERVIPGLWHRFNAGKVAPELLPLHSSHEILATYTDYDAGGSGAYTITIGYRVTNLDHIPEGLSGATVPAQLFARVAVEGRAHAAIPAAWSRIWTAFADEPYTRRFLADAEVYLRSSSGDLTPASILIGVHPW